MLESQCTDANTRTTGSGNLVAKNETSFISERRHTSCLGFEPTPYYDRGDRIGSDAEEILHIEFVFVLTENKRHYLESQTFMHGQAYAMHVQAYAYARRSFGKNLNQGIKHQADDRL